MSGTLVVSLACICVGKLSGQYQKILMLEALHMSMLYLSMQAVLLMCGYELVKQNNTNMELPKSSNIVRGGQVTVHF